MIHILLTILKIVGILLLVILGIVLFLVLAVLFVPFRYSISGEKYGGGSEEAGGSGQGNESDQNGLVLKGKVVFSWLAHLVHFRLRIQNQEKNENKENDSKIKTDMELYLFGIPVFALKNKISAIRQESKKKSKKKTDVKKTEDQISESAVNENSSPKQDTVEKNADNITENNNAEGCCEQKNVDTEQTHESDGITETNLVDEAVNLTDEAVNLGDETVEEEQSESAESTKPKKGNPIKKLMQTIKGIPQKIKDLIEKIKLTIRNICDKIKKGSDFLNEESTKATIRLLLGKLRTIFVHILPKKMKGNLIFGFDDPALTGEILGVVSLFYPKYKDDFKLIPVFDQQILEGKVQIKGRIVVAYLLWQVIKVVLDKNARLTLKNAQKLVKEIKQ